ncbi:MAG: hypothetical protein GQ569_02890 [Methylococcaceae bacterium]|nr:hypothetical protein [Methylococcaceae bacterium]
MKLQGCFIYTLFLLLVACADPLPPERMNYVGEWQGLGVSLLIMADGSVSYERHSKGAKTEINAPLQEFDGNNFIVGLSFFNTTFEVSKPPHQDDGIWRMTVDGVELTRVR